ncbi:MAG: hypothetical protein WCG04_01255 [Alphaproteobacteria bacterium]
MKHMLLLSTALIVGLSIGAVSAAGVPVAPTPLSAPQQLANAQQGLNKKQADARSDTLAQIRAGGKQLKSITGSGKTMSSTRLEAAAAAEAAKHAAEAAKHGADAAKHGAAVQEHSAAAFEHGQAIEKHAEALSAVKELVVLAKSMQECNRTTGGSKPDAINKKMGSLIAQGLIDESLRSLWDGSKIKTIKANAETVESTIDGLVNDLTAMQKAIEASHTTATEGHAKAIAGKKTSEEAKSKSEQAKGAAVRKQVGAEAANKAAGKVMKKEQDAAKVALAERKAGGTVKVNAGKNVGLILNEMKGRLSVLEDQQTALKKKSRSMRAVDKEEAKQKLPGINGQITKLEAEIQEFETNNSEGLSQ